MQTIAWNRQGLEEDFQGCQVLGDVIQILEDRYSKTGELVCEIHLNGTFLDEKEEHRKSTTSFSEIQTLEIVTRRSEDLVLETLRTTQQWIPQVDSLAKETAGYLLQGKMAEAGQILVETVEACDWLTQALTLLEVYLHRIVDDATFEEQWLEEERAYLAVIKELVVAHEQGDGALIADILENDLTESLNRWQELLALPYQILRADVE